MSASFDPKFIKFSTSSAVSSLLTGIVAYWKLNESSGTFASSVGTFPGSISGTGVTYDASGKLGRCITTAGTGYITMGTSTTLKPATALSVSAWFKTTSSGYFTILSNYTVGGGYWGYHMSIEQPVTNWIVSGVIGDGAGTHISTVDGTTAINTGAWFHAVFTSDGTNIKLYINGTQEGGNVSFPYSPSYEAGGDFEIGARDGGSAPLTGSVDEVGLWSRALTQSEVTALYNGGTGITHPF
jgi:hypothetical protein